MPKLVMLIALFVTVATSKSHADGVMPDEAKVIFSQFNQTMMKCPQRIWADYNWEGLKVVLLYPTKEASWLWDSSTNSVQMVANSSLPSSAIGSSYEFFELGGRDAMSLNMEEDNKEVFQLGVHEFFHGHGQKNWTNESSGGRGTEYPLAWQPRLYRRMLFDNLKKYLEFGQTDDLRRAKFWFNKWSNEYPNEPRSTTDGYEGTAEYVETMAEVIAKIGCSATEAQLKSQIISQVKSDLGKSMSGEHLALDSEGYEIGGLSALILRIQGGRLSDWNGRMSKGETPVQVLLESVSPLAENPSQALAATFQKSAQSVNSEHGFLLDRDIENWRDKNFVRIATPYDWLQSNLMPQFFAHSSQIQKDLYPLYTEHHYISPGGRSNFKLARSAVIFNHYTQPCQNQYSFTLVPAASVVLTNRVADISTPSVTGRLVGEIKTDEQGYQYLCVE